MPKALWRWTVLGLLASSAASGQTGAIGLVKTASGEATIERSGERLAARPGAPVLRGDVLRTGSPGTMGITLRDDTTLALGSSSEVHMVEFTFEPAAGKLAMLLRVSRGVVGYASGRIAKLAPEAARIETPVATLGIRGTRLATRVAR